MKATNRVKGLKAYYYTDEPDRVVIVIEDAEFERLFSTNHDYIARQSDPEKDRTTFGIQTMGVVISKAEWSKMRTEGGVKA